MTTKPSPRKNRSPEPILRCAAYLRISKDQTGEELGVTRQREDCRDLADRLGWELVTQYVDNDTSAYTGRRRDGFEAMLTAMNNHQIDAVVAYALEGF
jgi:site-specific DNA recombinase